MGIRASGEDGLIDREGKEGNRNQDRPKGGQEVGVPSALCVLRGQELLQPQSHPLAVRPGGLCAACPHPGEEGTGGHRPRLGFQAVRVWTESILSDKWMWQVRGEGSSRVRDSP